MILFLPAISRSTVYPDFLVTQLPVLYLIHFRASWLVVGSAADYLANEMATLIYY